jgi:hypothetical protein
LEIARALAPRIRERAAIDEFVELAQVKVPRSSSELLRDRSRVLLLDPMMIMT